MAAIEVVCEAAVGVLLDNGYRLSTDPGQFTSTVALDRQFYVEGPRLANGLALAKRNWHDAQWELDFMIQFEGKPVTVDAHRGRFEAIQRVDELLELWGKDATLSADELSAEAADPEWDDENDLWVVPITLGILNRRVFS